MPLSTPRKPHPKASEINEKGLYRSQWPLKQTDFCSMKIGFSDEFIKFHLHFKHLCAMFQIFVLQLEVTGE